MGSALLARMQFNSILYLPLKLNSLYLVSNLTSKKSSGWIRMGPTQEERAGWLPAAIPAQEELVGTGTGPSPHPCHLMQESAASVAISGEGKGPA